MVFTPHQKADLEEVFQKTKYPSRREKETMSKLFGVPKKKIEAWFSKRRLKWKSQQKDSGVHAFGSPSRVLGHATGQDAYYHSDQITPIPAPDLVTRPHIALPNHLFYPSCASRVLQPYPGSYYLTTAASSYPAYEPVPTPDLKTNSLAGQIPFPDSIENDLPYIFGNVDEEKHADGLTTPSVESDFPILYELLQGSNASEERRLTHFSEESTVDHPYSSCRFARNCQPFLLQKDISSGSSAMNLKSFRQD